MPTTEELEAEIAQLRKELSESKEENKLLKEKFSSLEGKYKLVVEESKQLHEEIASLRATVSAVVARGVGAKANNSPSSSSSSNHKNKRPPGRKNGHEGKSRKKPLHIDASVEGLSPHEIDQFGEENEREKAYYQEKRARRAKRTERALGGGHHLHMVRAGRMVLPVQHPGLLHERMGGVHLLEAVRYRGICKVS